MRFGTIVVDPPWAVRRPAGWGRGNTKANISQPYPTLSTREIGALPVPSFAANTSFLFLWTVNAFVAESYEIVRAWGFRPVTLLTWCKTPRGMGPGGAFATTTEFCLFSRKGTWERGSRRLSPTSWFNWPRRGQSEKPAEFYSLVESHFPAPRLDMFARVSRPGWVAWGNEVGDPLKIGFNPSLWLGAYENTQVSGVNK